MDIHEDPAKEILAGFGVAVPPGALAVSAGSQRNIEGWVVRKRPGSAAARAAEQALGHHDDSQGS